MKFAIVGGDERSAALAELVRHNGHSISTYALEMCNSSGGVGCLQGCTYGANAVILPIPSLRDGFLNTPLSYEKVSEDDIIMSLWPGQYVFGTGKELGERVSLAGAIWQDITGLPAFSDFNSALTAEGAIGIIANSSPRSIIGSRILVTGSGNLSHALTSRLRGLGGDVTVCARRGGDIDFSSLPGSVGEYDFIINTVPSRVITEDMIYEIRSDALSIELSSPPYGIDPKVMQCLGKKLITAPGLPGKTSPVSAAEYLYYAIYSVMEVRNGQ